MKSGKTVSTCCFLVLEVGPFLLEVAPGQLGPRRKALTLALEGSQRQGIGVLFLSSARQLSACSVLVIVASLVLPGVEAPGTPRTEGTYEGIHPRGKHMFIFLLE